MSVNTAISLNPTDFPVRRGDTYHLLGVARGAVAESDIAVALGAAGFRPLSVYSSGVPADWPTAEEDLPPLSQDERPFRAEGVWAKSTNVAPTAIDAGPKNNGGAVIIYQAWSYLPVGAPTGVSNTQLDDAFWPALIDLANRAGVPPEWFLQVFYVESRLNPNPPGNPSYAGLSQLSVQTLQNTFHVDPTSYRSWPASRQVSAVITPWYLATIRDYLGRAPRSPGVLYALNIGPAAVKAHGDGPNSVIYPRGSREAAANAGLDYNRDGALTISDFDSFMAQRAQDPGYKAAAAKLASYTGDRSTKATRGLLIATLFLGGSVAAAYYIQRHPVRMLQQVRARR